MNDRIIIDVTAPFYAQFKELSELYEEEGIDYKLLKQFRKYFSLQCFYELKLIKKAENRRIKREFIKVKREEKRAIKKDKKTSKQSKRKQKLTVKPLNASKSHKHCDMTANPQNNSAP